MKEQIENIRMFNKKFTKAGKCIFNLELEVIKLRAELEVEKRYTSCLENALEKQIRISVKGE